ncbi:DUF4815 domain-containing protein [Bilophila wadsworthia]|uniref:DUF4815 domain-containing protein n=1 Tax=Bilophila wadsworthia TaxID=35833 RepID=UPI003AB549E4
MAAKSIALQNYYNRFDETKNYDMHLVRDGNAGQGAEINEIQSSLIYRIKKIADGIYKDGDVLKDAQIVVDAETGEVKAQNGQVYINGAVRGVPAATFTVPVTGTVAVGIYMRETVVTELEDPTLYNPAVGSDAEGEPGAARLQVTTEWGVAGGEGDFFPVYTIDDGVVRSKETPPAFDSMLQALAGYDRDATGGSYIVSGLTVLQAADAADGRQVYTVGEGRARVNGYGVTIGTSRRVLHNAVPALRFVEAEGKLAQGGQERVSIDFPPMKNITRLRITKQSSATLTHGSFAGCSDTITDTGVIEIVSVVQGDTTYTAGSDYALTANAVDWSPTGAEPATGSTYVVTYKHLLTVQPESSDATGYVVSDAVAGTLIEVSYNQMLPRIDTLALDADGGFSWLIGVATTGIPRPPVVPQGMLGIASINQTWTDERSVSNNGDRVVPNTDIIWMNRQIESIRSEVARQRLESDIAYREGGMKKGLFVDPFLDDSMRDQGVSQTGAIVDGILTLPVTNVTASGMGADIAKPQTLPLSPSAAVSQPLRTSSMQVNPYMAFELTQGKATLTPAVDRWTERKTTWASPITRAITIGSGDGSRTSSQTQTLTLGTTQEDIEYLRRIDIAFSVEGFGAGENLSRVLFDGIEVTPA